MSAGPRSDAGARERERSRSLSPGPRAGSPAATLPRLSGARGALPDGGAARSESPFVSPRASELRAERERLLAAAKRVDEEMQLSEKQAREQQALAERIGGELQKAGTPRHGRPETPAGAAHQQPRVGEAPAKQRAEQAQPVIQRALPPQVRVPAPAPAPAAGAGQDARAAAPAAGVGVKVTGETVSAAVAVAAAVMDQHAARTDGQRASGGVPDSGDSQGHPDIGMKSLLETESQALLVMQFSESGSAIMRTDLSRTGLLDECRNDIDPQRRAGTARKLSKSTSYGQLAELEREPPANPRGHDTAAGPHGTSSLAHLHLRDLRYLQGVSDHHIMPRCGALVVSLGLVNVVMTHRNAYFVVPDGADKLLQPMLTRLHKGHRNTESEMPFELRVLEAVLLTLITFHSESVERCLADKTAISEGIKARMGSNMLTQIWKLKNEVFQIIQDIQGCERAVEEVQADKEALALMYMSAMREDPAAYMLLLRSQQGNTEHVQLLLDAYALEFNALSSQLYLVQKEIEATEELLTLQLDVARNNLWKVDILVGMASMWISVALLVSGFFGVNLYESWSEQMTGPFTPLHNATKVVGENPSWAWFDVTIVSGAGALGLILITTFMLWAKGYLVS